jgi:hypothetical protein
MNARAKAQNVPEIAFDSVPNFIKMPPNLYLGEGIGVASNSKGHVFVYTRSQDTRLFEFDQRGNFVRELGQGLYGFVFAHAVRVDPQDNVWAVDEGSNMVIKFNPEGRVVMVLGRRPEPAINLLSFPPGPVVPPLPYVFDRPTDVGWDPAGNIFVADGYVNSRVVKYDKYGHYITEAGHRGSGPGEMTLVHALVVDNQGNVYVGSRSDARVVVFDNDLKYKTTYDNVGAPWSICISSGPHQYLYVSNSNPDSNDSEVAKITGQVFKMELDGTVLGKFGVPGREQGQFSTVHGLDCRNPDEILVTEIVEWRMQKFILHPTASQGGK